MRPGGLLDTGALLALVDARERAHAACADAYGRIRLPLITTSAVLTESFYFALKRDLRAAVWHFIREASIVLAPIADTDLPTLEALMARYADRPMNFADATLVHVAHREGIRTILTVDRADFETYRVGRNAKFRILPAR